MLGFKLYLCGFVFVAGCSASGTVEPSQIPNDASGSSDTPSMMRACVPGATQACACIGGGSGVQTCSDDGSRLGACVGCPTPDASPPIDSSCLRNCTGRSCGDDGCGGQCGSCASGQMCSSGTCVSGMSTCTPQCSGRVCGPDSCGGSCGDCTGGSTCNAMSGRCCARQCAGRACGPDGCGGSCGSCPGGTTCNTASGACERVCVPSCGGRNCGPDGCGGSCGTCSVGLACSPSGVCQATCFANSGDPCATDSDCCPQAGGGRSRCVRLTGVGTVCTAVCTAASECLSGCCVSLTDGTRACNIPLFCASTSACYAGVGQACGRDADCCRETAGLRNPTACTCFGTSCACRALCSQNSDCTSGCCARRDDGVRICAPATSCP